MPGISTCSKGLLRCGHCGSRYTGDPSQANFPTAAMSVATACRQSRKRSSIKP
jgi:hypothetical protein